LASSVAVPGDWRLPGDCSPLLLFDSSGSSLARASARLFGPEPASRSGFSLAHDDRPFLSGHYEVTVPDLPLQRLAGPSSGPLARGSLLVPVCPRHWRSQRPLARCPGSSPSIPVSPRISASPSGLAPSGSQCSLRFATEKLAFPNSPMSVAPRPVGTPPADRRSEFATASEAGCSSNLLEPIQFSHSGI
jgi:hypothetical protein